jgi:dihydroorotate dehydrogenase electron transfer subunit
MQIEQARVVKHEQFSGDYRLLTLEAPVISALVEPGQFVHVRVPRLEQSVLRRPFSVYQAASGRLGILYKQVGKGTEALARVVAGEALNLIGPLGNGFPVPEPGSLPVLVAGGYGVAPLRLLASRLKDKGVLFVGGRTAGDILCVQDFEAMGWPVQVATEDGSLGIRGWVTSALDTWLAAHPGAMMTFYACGPDGMLKAVGERAVRRESIAWLSLDKHMGCGVGACLACVQKIRLPDGEEVLERVCREGPVFEAREIVWP